MPSAEQNISHQEKSKTFWDSKAARLMIIFFQALQSSQVNPRAWETIIHSEPEVPSNHRSDQK